MEWSLWLQGGPFLEVSYLLELKEDKKQTIQDIIDNLSKMKYKVEIMDKNVDDIIDFFDKGYSYDEDVPQSITLNSLRLRLFVFVKRKRKATLQIEMVSPNTLLVNFWFYGSEFDEPDWDQVGIMKEEMSEFTRFLKELYSVYEFKIGGIAIEQNVLELFEFGETHPNECYRYENLSPDHFLNEAFYFEALIWNEKYEKLNYIPFKHKRLEKNGILMYTGNDHD